MTDTIRRLDEATVERIAAGEVVERPASVVKELVENSLDADAARVEVAVDAGGKEGVRVTDDGVGMTADEARRAVEQHTTSKIRDIDDLESGVGTLGFRGEALHAIGAVSRVTMRTRPRADREDVDAARGTELVVEGGDVTSVEPAGCPEGTTIEVDDLFYNVPARRKYLKRDGTEFAHVNTVVTSYALANPDVAVSLTHDDRETFATTGQNDRREAVMAVYGRDVAESMVPVDARDGELPDGPLDGVSGLVSHPETNRSSREYLMTYVNGRYVTANAVRDAVVDAYGSQLAPDRYPFSVLFLDVPAGDVDVNVHPRKLDVRFADEEGVRAQILTAVESALLDAGLLRSGAPRGKSAPDQARIDPGDADSDGDGTGSASGDGPTERAEFTIDGDSISPPAETPEKSTSIDEGAPESRETGGSAGGSRESTASSTATDRDDAGSAADDAQPAADDAQPAADDAQPAADDAQSAAADPPPATGDARGDSEGERAKADSATDSTASDSSRKFSGGHEQSRLGGEPVAERSAFDSLPSMRVLGQLHDTYLLAETDEGLVLIDQHAADERINYERLREAFSGETTTQALARPVELSLTAREAELFETYREALATLGFRAERADDRTVEVRTVPSLVADAADAGLLRDVLAAFVTDGSAAETVEAAADELLADLACYPSVTGNTSLTDGSMRELLSALDGCENPWACPHGRPVVIEVDADEIEARFERDYPGHR